MQEPTAATHDLSLKGNRILAAIPAAELQRWLPHLERIEMKLGQVIFEPGGELEHAYFPLNAIVSLLYVMENGESAEIALVGNDGLLGVTVMMGGNSTTMRAVVQSAGQGWRLPAGELLAEVQRGGETLRLLLLYAQALLTQMTQTAACNRHHTLNQQFCRWLLMSFDRLGDSDMVMTQQLIAKMLGVSSEEVTAAAQLPSRGGADALPAGWVDASGAEWSLFCPGMGIALDSWLRLIARLVRPAAGSGLAWALAPPLARTLGQTLVQALVQTPAKPRL